MNTGERDRWTCGGSGRRGQALAYAVGAREILRLRERARTELGPRFRAADYHDRVLNAGAVPLHVLDLVVDLWIRGDDAG
ncbi:DUF885 family protein [Catenuloplanes japonicus]|uniref:DUF885 family protein n=1 Tax=Catenuloplanes japonicus TaxID=33876 RepID=UPI000526E6B3